MIYCVEDDNGIRDLMVYTLNASRFEAKGFAHPKEFWGEITKTKPELIMLDIMLPEEDGISILKKIRLNPNTKDIPVIMATAKGTEYDKIRGLDLGADDYLAKPFGIMEMVSRVKAVLRRTRKSVSDILNIDSLQINKESHRVFVDGKEIVLTLKEYDLLTLLASNLGMVFTRDQLLEKIWGVDYFGETRTVDVHVGTLRMKLGKFGEKIETVRGVGYRMEKNQ